MMMLGVLRTGHNFKIFKAIIGFVAVFVMHDLGGFENAPNLFFHNGSMLKNGTTFYANSDISLSRHEEATFSCIKSNDFRSAGVRAEWELGTPEKCRRFVNEFRTTAAFDFPTELYHATKVYQNKNEVKVV